jgi:hypothetical protein
MGLESPLPASDITTASLGLRTLRGSEIRAARPVSAVREARRAPLPLLRFLDAKLPAVELVAVQPLDRRDDGSAVGELDEREASRPAARAVGRQEYVHDFTDLGKQLLELATGRFVAQVPYEYLGVYDVLLVCWSPRSRISRFGRGTVSTRPWRVEPERYMPRVPPTRLPHRAEWCRPEAPSGPGWTVQRDFDGT